jgi:hypothetical protein
MRLLRANRSGDLRTAAEAERHAHGRGSRHTRSKGREELRLGNSVSACRSCNHLKGEFPRCFLGCEMESRPSERDVLIVSSTSLIREVFHDTLLTVGGYHCLLAAECSPAVRNRRESAAAKTGDPASAGGIVVWRSPMAEASAMSERPRQPAETTTRIRPYCFSNRATLFTA